MSATLDVERLADMVTAACGASMPQPSYRLYEPKVRASFIERYRRAAGGEAMTTDDTRDRLAAQNDCTHSDERGSTIMQASDDRYECIVCGERFRLVPARLSLVANQAFMLADPQRLAGAER